MEADASSHNANMSCGSPRHEILQMLKFKGVQSAAQQIHGGVGGKFHQDL